MRDENVGHVEDLIAGVEEPGAQILFFAEAAELLAVPPDLQKCTPAENVRKSDIRRHPATIGHPRGLHRRRPGSTIGLGLRARDGRDFRMPIQDGQGFPDSIAFDQMSIVVHEKDVL